MARRGLAPVPADRPAQTAPVPPPEVGDSIAPDAVPAPDGATSVTETAARQGALEAVLRKVRQRWGQGSIVRLDGGAATGGTAAPRRPGEPGAEWSEPGDGAWGTGRQGGNEAAPHEMTLLPSEWCDWSGAHQGTAAPSRGRRRPAEEADSPGEAAPAGVERRGRARHPQELPRWWPAGGAAGPGVPGIPRARPRILELVGETGSGQLTLALAWIAAAQPALAAVVDPGRRALGIPGPGPRVSPDSGPQVGSGPSGPGPQVGSGPSQSPGQTRAPSGAPPGTPDRPAGWFYAPAAASAGIDLRRLVVVRPPEDGEARDALDAIVVLLRSEAFDVVLCPLPASARISTTFAGMLATLAARSGTTLFLLTSPRARGLGPFAEYRVRLGRRRWVWRDGEIAGIRLRAAIERARAAAGMTLGVSGEAPPEHELTLRLHRRARHGPPAGDSPAGERPATGAPDRLYLAGSTRLAPQPGTTGLPEGPDLAATLRRGLQQNAG